MSGSRARVGGRLDRSRPLSFNFNGRRLSGFAGDTLASALIANGVDVVGRSFKYHRPRGIIAAGAEEPNALVQLGSGKRTEPNLKATQVELYDGLVATSVNVWPTAEFDVRAIHDRFANLLPAGFYYKTFMWPSWHLFEGPIRRAAGLGVAPRHPDPDRYEQCHAHCDVLVVGGGAAGLAAALAASHGSARVILLDEGSELGGSLLWESALLDGAPAADWVHVTLQQLSRRGVRLLPRTTAFGYYEHNLVGALERVTDHLPAGVGGVRQRFWKIRAAHVVLATGAHERPLVFANNDRPGVMLAAAAEQYATRFAALPGRRAVVFATHDSAHASALALHRAGVEIAAVVDVRPQVEAPALRDLGIPVYGAAAVVNAIGRTHVRAAVIADSSSDTRTLDCDLICVSGGWSPAVHLFSQSGGSLRFCETRLMFLPAQATQPLACAGAANGTLDLADALTEGWAAGTAAIAPLGAAAPAPELPTCASARQTAPAALWSPSGRGKAFVDFANDVTAADIALAARENYVSVEHLKRYTTLGMGVDQGKTSNVNGLAILGEFTGRTPAGVGTTKFRPPYTPVTFGAIVGPYRGDLARPRRYLPAQAWHAANGALFEEFGGWERPAAYPLPGENLDAAAAREALAVRTGVGIFDGSPLGKIEVSGPDAARFLDRIYVGTASTLPPGRARYGLMLNENGIIVDDGVFVRLASDRFLVHTTSGGADRIAATMEAWLQCEWVDLDVVVVNVTTQWANLTVSGPDARKLVARLCDDIDLSPEAFPHMTFRTGRIDDVAARVLRVSFTGEASYEINVPARYGQALFEQVSEKGGPFDLVPFGIEALMILRTEKGYLHVGVDTDGTTLPGDVGMAGAIEKKASDFIGRRSLMRPDARREDRLQLVGIASADDQVALPIGAHVLGGTAPPCDSDGFVTSSYMSPVLKRPVALGLVRNGRQRKGDAITLYDMGRTHRATIVAPTFYDPHGKRLHD